MDTVTRRHALKALGASAMATAAGLICRPGAGGVPELKYQPEKGATLRMLRWKRYVQGDEDQWLDNTRKFFELTGVTVNIESVGPGEVPPKAAMAAGVGAGPDIVFGGYDMPQLYPDKCLDVTDLAQYLGNKYGGWYDTCKRYCTVDSRWIALGMGFLTQCLVYRKSMLAAAGFSDVPQDLSGFMKLCKSLKGKGTPVGLSLGHATTDANTWCDWLIWAHGGKMVDEQNQVVINSRETLAALEYAKELYQTFVNGTLSWLDPSNNKAFLAGDISLTYNAISIYYVAKHSKDPMFKAMTPDIHHTHMPVGPAGRRTELAGFVPMWIFKHTKYPNAAREYLRFMLEQDQYELWLKASSGFFSQTLKQYESAPFWNEDPKQAPYRMGPQLSLYSGYAGSLGPASAASFADFIVVDMVAEAASGQSTPQGAAARAEQRARRYYRG
jgi:multiple sugar transport system substrate-binding protein